MNKQIVKFILDELISKFFPGIDISFKEDSERQRKLVSCYHGATQIGILCSDGGKFIIKRSQPFEIEERKIISVTFDIANDYSNMDISTQEYLIISTSNKIIAHTLVDDSEDAKTKILNIASIIDTLEKWSSETYEGSRISVSIGVDMDDSTSDAGVLFSEYIKEDFAKVISNGFDTIVEFSAYNIFLRYAVLNFDEKNHTAPLRFSSFAAYTKDNRRIAFVLNRNGEILIFKSGKLLFAKRRGGWSFFPYSSVIKQLAFKSKKLDERIRDSLYESILDVSFARVGACIGIVKKNMLSKFYNDDRIDKKDRFGESKSNKMMLIKRSINSNKFYEVNRRLRQEMLGIDGAVVINSDGSFITVGAIIKLSAGSDGGARLAAAKTLKEYGVAIKISADGEVKVFSSDKSFAFA